MYPWSENCRQNKGEIASLPNQYPEGQEVFGTLALNDFEAFETRRSIELGVEFPPVAGMVAQRENILTI